MPNRPRLATIARILAATAAVCLSWSVPAAAQQEAAQQEAAQQEAVQQKTGPSDRGAVAALQRTIVEVIAEAEPSVVAISRSAVLNQPKNARARVNGAQRLLPNQQLRAAGVDPLAAHRETSPALPPHAFGAGVVIGKRLVLTQYLAVKSGEAHTVTTVSGDEYPAKILASDPRSGLAVLSLAGSGAADLRPLPIGRAEDLRKGTFVVAIGNPFAIQSDGQPTASWGAIANTARKAPPGENLNNVTDRDGSFRTTLHHFGALIQTDARLGWNASGGALVTLDGQLVGITTTASTIAGHERPAGYAIPLNKVIRRVVGDLREGREPEYGLLGLSFDRTPVSSQNTGRTGIGVTTTFRGSPASRAGLRAGDLILTINGEKTTDADSLQLVVSSLPPGTDVDVAYERDGRTDSTALRLGKAFVEGERVSTRRRPTWRGMRVDFATAVPGNVLMEAAQEGRIDPDGCVVVSEVEEGSASWQSGVRAYAFISHIDGKRVTTPAEFYAAVNGVPESVTVKFTKALQPEPAVATPNIRNPFQQPNALTPQAKPNPRLLKQIEERQRLLREFGRLIEPMDNAAAEDAAADPGNE